MFATWMRVVACLACWLLVHGKVELSCSVIVYNANDYLKVDKNNQSFCIDGVERAARRCGGDTINFVPYAKYTYQRTKLGKLDVAVPTTLVYDLNGRPASPSRADTEEFYQAMSQCMVHAVKKGFSVIAITPHLDAWNYDLWRNLLTLEPYTSYAGTTYKEAVMDPLVQAGRDALANGARQIRFALEGEMNQALTTFPGGWLKLLNDVRSQFNTRSKWSASAVRVGISMNWNKLCGELCERMPPRTPVQKKQFLQLLQSCDFIGVSSYPSQWETWSVNRTMDFGSGLRNIDSELQRYVGVGLHALAAQGVQLQLSEFGIGGGKDSYARESAPDLRTLTSRIYAMVGGPYGQYQDPWKQKWAQSFRQKFIVRALWWLQANAAPDTPPRKRPIVNITQFDATLLPIGTQAELNTLPTPNATIPSNTSLLGSANMTALAPPTNRTATPSPPSSVDTTTSVGDSTSLGTTTRVGNVTSAEELLKEADSGLTGPLASGNSSVVEVPGVGVTGVDSSSAGGASIVVKGGSSVVTSPSVEAAARGNDSSARGDTSVVKAPSVEAAVASGNDSSIAGAEKAAGVESVSGSKGSSIVGSTVDRTVDRTVGSAVGSTVGSKQVTGTEVVAGPKVDTLLGNASASASASDADSSTLDHALNAAHGWARSIGIAAIDPMGAIAAIDPVGTRGLLQEKKNKKNAKRKGNKGKGKKGKKGKRKSKGKSKSKRRGGKVETSPGNAPEPSSNVTQTPVQPSPAISNVTLHRVGAKQISKVAKPVGKAAKPVGKVAKKVSITDKRAIQNQLKMGGYPISAAFLWCMGSMDFAAIYHLSTNQRGSYYSEADSAALYAFNERGELPAWQ